MRGLFAREFSCIVFFHCIASPMRLAIAYNTRALLRANAKELIHFPSGRVGLELSRKHVDDSSLQIRLGSFLSFVMFYVAAIRDNINSGVIHARKPHFNTATPFEHAIIFQAYFGSGKIWKTTLVLV